MKKTFTIITDSMDPCLPDNKPFVYLPNGLLNPDMPLPSLLHVTGEMNEREIQTARAMIARANREAEKVIKKLKGDV